MEIEFSSTKWNEQERLYPQSMLVLFLALGIILWGNFIVFADPSSTFSVEEDSKVPLSDRVFDSAGEWRAPQKPKSKWREPKEKRLTIQKDRIQKKKSSLYDPIPGQDNRDPYSSPGHPDNLTKPAKILEFKF